MYRTSFSLFGAVLLLVLGCSTPETVTPNPGSGLGVNPEATDIDSYLRSLTYDPVQMLNLTTAGGGTADRQEVGTTTERSGYLNGYRRSCTTTEYNLKRNFSGVSILQPTAGVVYPGALVTVGPDLVGSGIPLTTPLRPAPVTLKMDLPGIGDAGRFTVDRPTNSTVNVAIDQALQSWNANASPADYTNASRSEYEAGEAFTSEQIGIDIGMNVEWASSSVASYLSVDRRTDRRTAMVAYKQIFYTVTADAPGQPSSMLAPDVTLAQVEAATGDDRLPGYVSSVDYGRIILFQLDVQDSEENIDLSALINYATATGNAQGSVNATLDRILRSSNIQLITIGGNAEAAASTVSGLEAGPGALTKLIARNAVYGPDNPGVPIAYKINLLRDNQIVRMGYTTDYSTKVCGDEPYDNHVVTVYNKPPDRDVRIYLRYSHRAHNDIQQIGPMTIRKATSLALTDVPDGGYNISMVIQRYFLTKWSDWKVISLGSHIERGQNEHCYDIVDRWPGEDYVKKCAD